MKLLKKNVTHILYFINILKISAFKKNKNNKKPV